MLMKNIILHHNELPEQQAFSPFSPFENVLVQVFAATSDLDHLQKVLDTLTAILPRCTVIGCSTDGTIDDGSIHPHGDIIQLTVTAFEHTTLSLASSDTFENSFRLGKMLASQIIRKETQLLISFSEASSVNGEHYLEGIDHHKNGIKVAGGVASTPTFTDTFVIADGQILKSGAVAVALHSTTLHVYTDFLFGWEPIGKKMAITDVRDNIIHAIDNKTPLEIFRHYLGEEVADAMPGTGSAFPLLLKRDGQYIARGIIGVEGESFIVSGNVRNGDKVFIGYGNPDFITKKNTFNIHLQHALPSVETIFNYYCEGRHLFLPDDAVRIEAENLSNSAINAGCFTLGEFFSQRTNVLHNFSSTIVALSENAENVPKHPMHGSTVLNDEERLSAMITRGLFHLIDVRTKELQHQTYHDALTSLPNRNFFNEMLTLELEKAKKEGSQVALLFLDLDNFKDVNDTLGHGSGDYLLKIIAGRIKRALSPSDLLARWSGDEFVVMRSDCHSIDLLTDLATSVLELFKEPIQIDNHHFTLGVSIGISLFPNDGSDAETLVKHADAAMYSVKSGGRNHFSFYRREMTEKALQRITLENDLRSAIRTQSFYLVYQPQIDLESGKIKSVEALLRWRHPKKGVIMPDQFIGVAERSGLILPIGEMIMDMALGQFRVWKNEGLPIEKISVNVSAKQFRYENIVGLVNRYLGKYDLSPDHLEIELTESTLMHQSDTTIRTLDELHRLGISISVDDFGTGYSSLSYLKRFKINNIKIDKSFVEHLPDNINDMAIVKAIIALARALGLDIIVEGIENSRQKAFFQSEGRMLAQGYFYSKPLDAEELEKALLTTFV